MRTLIVRYEKFIPKKARKRAIVSSMKTLDLGALRMLINCGAVDEVILAGPNVCLGWRLYVQRPVEFQWRVAQTVVDENYMNSASQRILQERH